MRDIFTASNYTVFSINKNQSYYSGANGLLPTIWIKTQSRDVGRSLILVQKRYIIHEIEDDWLHGGGRTAEVSPIFILREWSSREN